MVEINNSNVDVVLDKMIADIESKSDERFGAFCETTNKVLDYIGPNSEYSCLLLLFWGTVATLSKEGYSIYAEPACRVAFKAIKELINRNDTTAIKDLAVFTRDDLFLVYLEDRSLYYTIVNEFYLTIMGGYPEFYKNGYVNIQNVINGIADSGYMDADYIYIAAWWAEYAIDASRNCTTMDANDLEIYKTMKEMYFTFTSFANMGYGYESYNKPKEKKLYLASLGKPNGFSMDSEDKFRRRPVWTAMAYATADASGEYYWRRQVMKLLKEEDLCGPPREDEQRVINRRKKAGLFKIGSIAIVGACLVALLFMFRAHPLITSAVIALLAIAIVDEGANSSYGTNIWFVGHFYTGPAYWMGGWR